MFTNVIHCAIPKVVCRSNTTNLFSVSKREHELCEQILPSHAADALTHGLLQSVG